LPIKYVIQVILSICQNSRLYGPPDGVKSVATTVKLFFTRSQLSSYISRFASGYRLLVLSVLLAISISASFAQIAGDYKSAGTGDWKTLATWQRFDGSVWALPTAGQGCPGQNAGTGAVNIQVGHIVTISNSGITTSPMGTLTINGTLYLTGDNTANGIDFSLNTQKVVVIQNLTPTPATIFFNLKSNLRLPVTAIISVGANGLSGTCSHNASIYFDTLQFYTCAGGGPCGTFQNLMVNGGNATITLTSGSGTNIQTVCFNTPITPITYVVGNGASGANRTGTLPDGLTGIYTAANSTFTISGTPTVSGIFNYMVTTTGPGTCTNATATGTIIIAAGAPPTTTGITICQGGSGSLTSSFSCPAGGTFTSVAKAGIGTNVGGPGTISWSNPNNITLPVGSPYATANLNTTSTTENLQGTNYGFSIPADAIISGITVSIKRLSSLNILGVSIYDVDLKLLKNGTVAGNSNASAMGWPMIMDIATYGGTSDLWGTTWTASEINNANFGVSLSVGNPSFLIPRVATVDYIQISVTYTVPPATLDWYTAPSGGTKIGSGTTFNPVGVASSGLVDTNTPGTTTYYAACSTSPGCRTATDYIITPSLPASVIIAASPSGAICAGTSVTFTATPTNGGATPAYQWRKGGIIIPGEIGPTYTSTILADNDKITVEMTSNATCITGSPATSNEIPVTVTPSVGTPVFDLGNTSTRYQILESVPYTATATNSTGTTYSLDATSIVGGNSVISALGVVTYSPTWSGPSTITATATGCNGPTTAIHTVRTDWCFALFAGAGAILNTGALTVVTGDVGTHAGSFTGFTAGMIVGQMHVADPTSVQAKIDTELAYATLFATSCITPIGLTMGAGQILQPGVYCTNDATSLSGNLTLDGNNIPDASFIIKIGGALSTATNSTVTLINGADLKNVFWQVTGVVNLGINSLFQGTVINVGALNLLDGSTLWGRAITTAGAISLTNSTVSSICAPIPCMNDNVSPTFTTPTLNPGYCVEDIYQAVYKDGAEGTPTDLTFLRPDYYTLLTADLNMLNLISPADNCALKANPISWSITFADGRDNLTGNGQFSTYVPVSPLTGIEFPLGTNIITYTLTDAAVNTTIKSINLVVTPRPGFN